MTDASVFAMARKVSLAMPNLNSFEIIRHAKWVAENTNVVFDPDCDISVGHIARFVEFEITAGIGKMVNPAPSKGVAKSIVGSNPTIGIFGGPNV